MSVGKFADQGFAVGLTRHAGQVEEASKDVGKTAVNSLKKSMSGLSAIVNDEMDADPVIRPVLDLSSVRKDASQIGSMVGSARIGADVSYDQASLISRSRRNVSDPSDSGDTSSRPVGVNNYFEQHNYSPKAISPIETYRNTKNLLSMAAERT